MGKKSDKNFLAKKKVDKKARFTDCFIRCWWLHDRTVLRELIGLLRRESHRERVQQGGLARINKSATLYSVLNIAHRHHHLDCSLIAARYVHALRVDCQPASRDGN